MNRSSRPGIFSITVAVLLALGFLFPTVVVIGSSFTAGSFVTFPPQGISLRWYEDVFSRPVWLGAAATSLQLGLLSAVIAMVVGVLLALVAAKSRLVPSRLVILLSMVPILLPSVVAGLGLYLLFVNIGLSGSLWGLALAHASVGVPFVFVNVFSALTGADKSVEEAARISGANEFVILWRITFPMILPFVLIGGLLAFAISWDEVILAQFLVSPSFTTLPLEMYGAARDGTRPTVSAVSTMTTLVSIAILSAAFLALRLRPKPASVQ